MNALNDSQLRFEVVFILAESNTGQWMMSQIMTTEVTEAIAWNMSEDLLGRMPYIGFKIAMKCVTAGKQASWSAVSIIQVPKTST